MPSTDAAANPQSPATPRGRDAELSASHEPGSASTVGMFSPAPSSGADSAGEPDPSTATVDSDAARFPECTRGSQNRHVQEALSDGKSSSAMLPLRREELIPDSMRKTTLANLETKTLKAFPCADPDLFQSPCRDPVLWHSHGRGRESSLPRDAARKSLYGESQS